MLPAKGDYRTDRVCVTQKQFFCFFLVVSVKMGKQKLFQQSRTELQFVLLQRKTIDSATSSFHSDSSGTDSPNCRINYIATPLFTPINPSLASSNDSLTKSSPKVLLYTTTLIVETPTSRQREKGQ